MRPLILLASPFLSMFQSSEEGKISRGPPGPPHDANSSFICVPILHVAAQTAIPNEALHRLRSRRNLPQHGPPLL
jgi:hypothetical protein